MTRDYGAWINMLSHKLKKRINANLVEFGVTGVQSRILRYITEHCQEGPVFQRDVEEAFDLSRSTATGIMQLLEKNGFIRRETMPHDARLKSLVPTEKATQLIRQVRALVQSSEAVLTRGISPGQLQLFLEVAAKMSENLDG